MITFREIAPNKFVLLRESLSTFYMHNKTINKLEKCRSLEFNIKEEKRGTNEKFWLVNEEFNNEFMFKSNHRTASRIKENGFIYGELITDLICNRIGMDNTNYYPCHVIFEDGTFVQGSISPNYRKGKYNNEYSGESVTMKYIKSQYDNNNGIIPHIEYNTVYEYMKELKSLYGSRLGEQKIQTFKQYLLQMALLDYATCQTDRHWGNIGWMRDSQVGMQTMTYIPLYDNESCFLLNKSLEWIDALAEKLEKTKNGKKTVIGPMVNGADRTPRLGVKTATTICKDGVKILKKPLIPGQRTNIEVFQEEIADEILNNKKLEKFYKKIKGLNLKKELQECEYFPESVISVVSSIWEVRIEQLEQILQRKREEGNEMSA